MLTRLFSFLVLCLHAPMTWAMDLSQVKSWGYYLSEIDPAAISASPYDLMVMDPTRDGEDSGRFTRREVGWLKQKPDGGTRLVVAYLSVGEAEDYRGYWQKGWKPGHPAWLDEENKDWPGNFKVRYWEPGWQKLIFGAPEAALDRIIAAGFDGVYLDLLDAFELYEHVRPTSADEMVAFVQRLRTHARKQRPGFLVIAQNAERLIGRPGFLDAIDAVAKEDLYFGQERDGVPTPKEDHAESLSFLEQAKAGGKLILTVDYIADASQQEQVMRKNREKGYIAHFATRELDRLTLPDGSVAAASGSRTEDEDFFSNRSAFFYAATVPAGMWRLVSRTEWYKSRFDYDYENEETGEYRTFTADSFYELSTAVELTYGFTGNFEAGLAIPVVTGHFSPDAGDHTGEYDGDVDEAGLGNIRLLTRYGREWNGGSDYALFSAEWGLPTDTRGDDLFGGYTDIALELNYEHFWNHVGISIAGGFDIYASDSFSDTETSASWRAGLLADISDNLFATASIGGTEEGTVRVEGSVEILVLANASVEVFGGVDVSGPEESAYAGIALSFVF